LVLFSIIYNLIEVERIYVDNQLFYFKPKPRNTGRGRRAKDYCHAKPARKIWYKLMQMQFDSLTWIKVRKKIYAESSKKNMKVVMK
jgi:hypothetical protein